MRLFLSHISEEAAVAALVKQQVEHDFLGFVEIFTSSDIDSITTGDDWLDTIAQAMKDAQGVLVLCSKASVQRPWVQFELGAAWMMEVPIVPVCHSGLKTAQLPMPLSRLQGVELGTETGWGRLYDGIAHIAKAPRTPRPADMPTLLEAVKATQVDASDPVQQFERYLDIVVPAPGRLGDRLIPDAAAVQLNAESLQLFGFIPGVERTWSDIFNAAMKVADRRWVAQLQECVRRASNNESFRPVQAVYHSEFGSYQPQLSKKELLPDGSCRFHVHLIETVVAPLSEVPNELGLLATLMRLGLRFRYEVIERFKRLERPAGPGPKEDLASALARLRDAIQVIECDALSRGSQNIDPDAVVAVFERYQDQAEMHTVQDQWYEARAALFQDTAMLTEERVAAVLGQMRDVNFRFMQLAIRRFNEIVHRRWRAPVRPRGDEGGLRAVGG